MEYAVLGVPPDGPSLTLDWQTFAYAGKFEMTNTGKAVLREAESILAAAAFNGDREDDDQAWIRYLTVRSDRHGEGLGPRLVCNLRETLLELGYERIAIAVNNPIAYRALYRAGFGFTGQETGIAELVLTWPADRSGERYRAGLTHFTDRDLPEGQAQLLDRWIQDGSPPEPVNGIP
ncbi:MAG: GNAT family N-acetyltransferase [Halobacteriota archaeon]